MKGPRGSRYLRFTGTGAASRVLGVGLALAVFATGHGGRGPRASDADQVVSPPSSIASDCSTDVSKALRQWLNSLPSNTTVNIPSGNCYQVDSGLTLNFPTGLTVDGGTFDNVATTPPTGNGHGTPRGSPVFNVIGGSGVTFSEMTIEGADPSGGFTAAMAFAGAIELQGTSDATISQVQVNGVFGDGVTLAPLRGGKDHNSGKIVSPVDNVTISGLQIDGAGREGITFGSVNGASVSNVTASNIGLDTFDVEADQSNEGAQNVTVNGCTSSSPATSNYARSFFSNDGPGAPQDTGNITVENCTMTEAQGTAAIQAERPGKKATPRGPLVFENDTLVCGQSISPSLVACLDAVGSEITLDQSNVSFDPIVPPGAVYSAAVSSSLTFTNDDVSGYASVGSVDSTSNVSVAGGTWTPAS